MHHFQSIGPLVANVFFLGILNATSCIYPIAGCGTMWFKIDCVQLLSVCVACCVRRVFVSLWQSCAAMPRQPHAGAEPGHRVWSDADEARTGVGQHGRHAGLSEPGGGDLHPRPGAHLLLMRLLLDQEDGVIQTCLSSFMDMLETENVLRNACGAQKKNKLWKDSENLKQTCSISRIIICWWGLEFTGWWWWWGLRLADWADPQSSWRLCPASSCTYTV